jgi:hypothetical protein
MVSFVVGPAVTGHVGYQLNQPVTAGSSSDDSNILAYDTAIQRDGPSIRGKARRMCFSLEDEHSYHYPSRTPTRIEPFRGRTSR